MCRASHSRPRLDQPRSVSRCLPGRRPGAIHHTDSKKRRGRLPIRARGRFRADTTASQAFLPAPSTRISPAARSSAHEPRAPVCRAMPRETARSTGVSTPRWPRMLPLAPRALRCAAGTDGPGPPTPCMQSPGLRATPAHGTPPKASRRRKPPDRATPRPLSSPQAQGRAPSAHRQDLRASTSLLRHLAGKGGPRHRRSVRASAALRR